MLNLAKHGSIHNTGVEGQFKVSLGYMRSVGMWFFAWMFSNPSTSEPERQITTGLRPLWASTV